MKLSLVFMGFCSIFLYSQEAPLIISKVEVKIIETVEIKKSLIQQIVQNGKIITKVVQSATQSHSKTTTLPGILVDGQIGVNPSEAKTTEERKSSAYFKSFGKNFFAGAQEAPQTQHPNPFLTKI